MVARTKILILGLLGLIASLALTGCSGGNLLSTKDEVRIGRKGSEEIEHSLRVDMSSADALRVRRIGERLILHSDPRPGIPYSFKVIDINEVNAASLPGGPVYVYRGLLDLIGDDDDALASVIGHELGHVNARHIAKQFTKQVEAGLLVGVLLQGKAPIAQELANAGLDLLSFKFSRDDENDADRHGISYAYKAGFDPHGMIRMFERLQSVEKKAGGGTPEWLRNHPLTAARIDRVKKIIETQDYKFGK